MSQKALKSVFTTAGHLPAKSLTHVVREDDSTRVCANRLCQQAVISVLHEVISVGSWYEGWLLQSRQSFTDGLDCSENLVREKRREKERESKSRRAKCVKVVNVSVYSGFQLTLRHSVVSAHCKGFWLLTVLPYSAHENIKNVLAWWTRTKIQTNVSFQERTGMGTRVTWGYSCLRFATFSKKSFHSMNCHCLSYVHIAIFLNEVTDFIWTKGTNHWLYLFHHDIIDSMNLWDAISVPCYSIAHDLQCFHEF